MSTKSLKTANKATRENSAVPPSANEPHVLAAKAVKDAAGQHEHALVAAVLLSITDGRFTPEHLQAAGYDNAGSAKSLASAWNCGAAVASIIGDKAAVKLVNDTVKAYPAGRYNAVLSALRDVKARAQADKVKAATPAQVRALVKDAPMAAAIADDKRRAALSKMRGTRNANKAQGVAATAAVNVAASKSYAEAASALLLIANTLTRAPIPEGMDAQARTFLKSLQDATEAGAPFRKA